MLDPGAGSQRCRRRWAQGGGGTPAPQLSPGTLTQPWTGIKHPQGYPGSFGCDLLLAAVSERYLKKCAFRKARLHPRVLHSSGARVKLC